MTQITLDSLSPDSFKRILKKLATSPDSFNAADTTAAFEHLLKPEAATPTQIGSFLTLLHITGLERRSDILAAAAKVLKNCCLPPRVDRGTNVIGDIVGTGGDGHDTFNVSTSAAIVAAGAGLRVCKHGNRSATSSSGSADLLLALGCPLSKPLTHLPNDDALPFSFLLAPHYHHSLAPLVPMRKSLPFRTILNLLGPLVNPAQPDAMIVGVPTRALGQVFAEALQASGTLQRGMVVSGFNGLDEISCAGGSWVWRITPGEPIKEESISPEDFGLPSHSLEAVKGGGPKENADILKTILTSGGSIPADLQPIVDFVLLNTSALLVVAGLASDYKEGVALAKESMANGRAWEALQKFRVVDAI